MANDLERRHDKVVSRVRLLADIIEPSDVANAFVSSLGSRQLEYRSALGSYAFARSLPDHSLKPRADTYATICEVCDWSRMPTEHEAAVAEDVTQIAFERKKYGGVRHLYPWYAAFDLEEFRVLPEARPTDEDWRSLDLILRTPSLLAPEAKAADLERAISTLLRSNKYERMALIRILSYAGVLSAPDRARFFDEFIEPENRELPPHRYGDWGYPVIWWRARHGVQADAVRYWFPRVST